jgi:hypothetical protein
MNFRNISLVPIVVGLIFATGIYAQPEAPLTGTNTACLAAANLADTLTPAMLAGMPNPGTDSGWSWIFDGKSTHGFWESCQSSHSSADRTYGGVWLVDSVNHLLFSNQNANGAGSILMTNKSYGNYELILDVWPSFGDDGGVFNRTTANGTCYQTTMDYIQGSSVGGVYFEGGYTGATRNVDPFVFGANKYTITIGTNSNATNRLDTMTKKYGIPADYGCPATGCGPANWTAIWDTGGWNQVRIKLFGTGASASNKVHNFAWIRKLGATAWVPTVMDSVQYNTPASYLGFQIHGGTGSWSNSKGHWYRNIKIRPLTDQGAPIVQSTSIAPVAGKHFDIRSVSGVLTGSVDADYAITVSDLSGRVLDTFNGRAGSFRHVLKPGLRGVFMVQIKTSHGVDYLRAARLFE